MNPLCKNNDTTTADHCHRCRYYQTRKPRNGGRCRRRAPVVTPGTAGDKCFPIVSATDWCGEFKEGSRDLFG